MLKMELAEVVNPHFAVPVFGVVLCAVLVFAFGFKSSVQPPSFDFDEEKRLKRRKAKKAQTNGHIPSISNAVAPVAKQQVSASKSLSSGKAVSSKPEEALQARLRSKKSATVSPKPATAKQDGVVKETPPEEDVDGWTTAISKKEKKRRNKEQQDDISKYDLLDQESGSEMKPEEIQEAPQAASSGDDVIAESPKGQRKRKERKQKPLKEVAKVVDEPSTANETEVSSTPEQAAEVTPEPEQVEEETPVEPEIPQKESEEAEITVKSEETAKRSPRKVRSKREKVAEAPTIEEPEPLPQRSKKSSEVSTAKEEEKSSDKRSKKSPKKKKKGAPQDVSDTVEKSSANQEEAAHISTGDTLDLSSSPKTVQETVSQGAARVSNLSESDATSNSKTEEASTPQASSSPPVTFDEIGAEDWIEAKPQKKKKKARREN